MAKAGGKIANIGGVASKTKSGSKYQRQRSGIGSSSKWRSWQRNQ